MNVVWKKYVLFAIILVAGCNSRVSNATVVENVEGFCCLCDLCEIPPPEKLLATADCENQKTCTDVALELADPTNDTKEGDEACLLAQAAYNDKCCYPSSIIPSCGQEEEDPGSPSTGDGPVLETSTEDNLLPEPSTEDEPALDPSTTEDEPVPEPEDEPALDPSTEDEEWVCDKGLFSPGTQPVCSLCSDGGLPTLASVEPALPNEIVDAMPELATCMDLHCMGLAGSIDDRVCRVLSDVVGDQCGCQSQKSDNNHTQGTETSGNEENSVTLP